MNKNSPQPLSKESTHGSPLPAILFNFIFLSSCIVVAGWLFYQSRENMIKKDKQTELSAIADLKAEQIELWLSERTFDAGNIRNDPFVVNSTLQWVSQPQNAALKHGILSWMNRPDLSKIYDRVTLTNQNGDALLSTSNAPFYNDDYLKDCIKKAGFVKDVVLCDLHRAEGDTAPRLFLIIPVVKLVAAKDVAVLSPAFVFELNPRKFLYPLIMSWPTPSRTSEGFLVRREGNEVVFLNDLKYKKNTALNLRVSIDKKDLPAVKAVLGERGAMEGIDYRGIPVLAVARPISGTNWFLVAKLDKNEAFAATQRLFMWAAVVVVLLILLVGLFTALFLRHQSSLTYRRLYLSEKEKYDLAASLAASEGRFSALFESMTEGVALHDVIFDGDGKPSDYRIITVNPAYEKHTGVSAQKAHGLLASELYGTGSPPYLEEFTSVGITGTPYFFETFFAPLNRHFAISVFSPGKNQFATVFEDITERQNAATALSAEKERLSVTLSSIGDGVIATDTKGAITLMNGVAQKLTGWTMQDAFGLPLAEAFRIVNEQTGVPCENPVEKVLKTGGTIGLANHTALIGKDGVRRTIADSGAPIRDAFGAIIGVVLVFRDITEKERIERELAESEKRYKMVSEMATDYVFKLSVSADGNVSMDFVSDNFTALTGRTRENAETVASWGSIIYPDDLGKVMQALKGLTLSRDSVELECRSYVHNRKLRWITIIVKSEWSERENRVTAIVGAVKDITERKVAEEELRRQRDRAQHYLDTVQTIIIALDSKGKIILINKNGCRLLGFCEEELIGQIWFTKCLPQPLGNETVYPVYEKLMTGELESLEYFENPVVTKQGEIRIIAWHNSMLRDDSGKIIGTLSSGEDITERKKAENALVAEKERLSVTLRSIGDAVIATDIDGRIVLMNKVAEALTGWPLVEAVGKPLTQVFVIINEITREPCANPVEMVLQSGAIVSLQNHTVLVGRNGRECVIEDSGAPIRDRESKTIGVVLVFSKSPAKGPTARVAWRARGRHRARFQQSFKRAFRLPRPCARVFEKQP
jgi:PAS domain S-box-containing protein